jgi:D-glycero-D-manno-heptose 1,7-bisphosphate phosphatase
MTGRPCAFLDRDGVLIEDVGYPHRPDQLILTPGAGRAVARMKRAGFLTVIVTNQSGVARGLFDLAQMEAFNALLLETLAREGGVIDAVYACPYHRDAVDQAFRHPDHPDRKPNPGMLLRAMADHGIDPAGSFMIGDQPSDMEAARRAGVRGWRFDGGDLEDFVSRILADGS